MGRQDRIDIACELRAITFNLATLIRMLEDEHPYYQTFCKIGSIHQALRSLRRSLIAHQIQESLSVTQNQHDVKTQLRELSQLQNLFREMIQNQ